jgi:hypothetical protein
LEFIFPPCASLHFDGSLCGQRLAKLGPVEQRSPGIHDCVGFQLLEGKEKRAFMNILKMVKIEF